MRGQVIWVDEAGLLSVKDMKRLFDVAKEQQARVVLSGDSKQHAGVYRGDALRILEKDSGLRSAKLSEIRRQTNESYREAVKAISEGDIVGKDGKTRLEAGFEMLDKIGAVVEAPGEDRYRKIAADYVDITSQRKGKRCKTALVISPTHAAHYAGTTRNCPAVARDFPACADACAGSAPSARPPRSTRPLSPSDGPAAPDAARAAPPPSAALLPPSPGSSTPTRLRA